MQTNDDRSLLIESIKTLTLYLAQSPHKQHAIFSALKPSDLAKIVTHLSDQHPILRKVAAHFLCIMAYKDSPIKTAVAAALEIRPQHGRICIGGIPKKMGEYPGKIMEVLKLLKTPLQSNECEMLFWAIDISQNILTLEFYQYKIYSPNSFIDPCTHLFGFTTPKIHSNITCMLKSSPIRNDIENRSGYRSRMKEKVKDQVYETDKVGEKRNIKSTRTDKMTKNEGISPMRSSINNSISIRLKTYYQGKM